MSTVDTPVRPASPAGPPPRTVWFIAALIVIALVVLAAAALTIVWVRSHGHGGRADNHVVTGPVGGRDAATLELLSGVTAVTVHAADLGDTLYRVDSPQIPSVTGTDGRVQVQIAGGNATVDISLNRDVRWTLRFTAGATSNSADLRDLRRLAGVEYVGGVSAIELTLPAPAGNVPVRMDGGASTFRVHAPAGVPVRVRAGGGAGGITIDGTPHNGVSAGEAFTSDGWDSHADRYDVDNAAGVSTVVVDRT